ncbi:MAG: Dabb family protein [Clostridia bacterium]|nr:Dabb family protein [Clostridia bacterium]
MVKHVILWKLKEMPETELSAVKADIKTHLESLAGKIPGLLEIKVYTNKLDSSNVDVMLDSSFESEAALKGYAVHPDHVAVADTYVRPFTATRACLDFTV